MPEASDLAPAAGQRRGAASAPPFAEAFRPNLPLAADLPSQRTCPAGSLIRDTTRVSLPGGLVLADGRRLVEAELRPLAGFEEDWLAAHPGVPSAVATTHLLGCCLVELDGEPGHDDLARRLLVGDRDFLMLQLRRLTLGERISAVLVCPGCHAKMDVDLTTADVPVLCRPQQTTWYDVEVIGADGSSRVVRIRLPTGADQEAVLGLEPDQAVEALLRRCVLDNGAAALDEEAKARLGAAIEERAPSVEIELDLTCPECGEAFVAPFDATAFFLDEVRVQASQLLREVHALAFYYHWNESEILGLTRARRRAYLALLADALRPG